VKKTDKAILLHRISYSESSLILTFYTFENGIQKFIFQGGKKKVNQLFPLALSEITYYKRPDSTLGKISSSDSYHPLSNLPFHPIKSTIAFFVAEVLLKCLQTEESEKAFYLFIENEIINLDKEEDVSFFPILFLLKLSYHMGIYPNTVSEPFLYFNLMEGEIGSIKPIGDIFHEGNTVNLLSKLITNQTIDKEDFSKQIRNDALQILIQYFQIHIPKFNQLNSLEVIREILYT
jgi:DNA repair protein RecO (recombination protein O)